MSPNIQSETSVFYSILGNVSISNKIACAHAKPKNKCTVFALEMWFYL